MEERKTKFTALGMQNAGKTCYVLGMYYAMVSGIKGWTLLTANATADKLTRWARIIDKENGMDRFPPGTTNEEFTNYQFCLHYLNKPIMSFDWIDYAGVLFESISSAAFATIEKAIETSTALYIFLDGEDLCFSDVKERMKNIGRHCSRYIQPHITTFMTKHKGQIPPVVFVITKADLCRKYITMGEIKEILDEKFSSLLYDPQAKVYVTAVSLGEDLADDDYSGEVDPINVQIPFFIGIYHELVNQYKKMSKTELDENGTWYRTMINNLVYALNEQSQRFTVIEGGLVKDFDLSKWAVN